MSWRSEQGDEFDVPSWVQELVQTGQLRDVSWHNDTCPCFEVGAGSIILWVDHPVAAFREIGGPRFVVAEDEGDEAKTLLATEDEDAAKTLVNQLMS